MRHSDGFSLSFYNHLKFKLKSGISGEVRQTASVLLHACCTSPMLSSRDSLPAVAGGGGQAADIAHVTREVGRGRIGCHLCQKLLESAASLAVASPLTCVRNVAWYIQKYRSKIGKSKQAKHASPDDKTGTGVPSQGKVNMR